MPAQNASDAAFSVKAAPSDEFVTIESSTLNTDAGRLKPMYRTASDGGCFFHRFWDEQLQTPCSFVANAPNGPYFCQPTVDATSRAVTLEAFSDSSCMASVSYVKVAKCDAFKPPKFSIVSAQTCTDSRNTFRSVDLLPNSAFAQATLEP